MRHPILTFNSGEISPQVDARSDVDKYRAGCRTLENMIPRIYGTAERRPGTKYIDTCNGVSRVIPFIYSSTIAYIVLMEDLRFWFYFDGGRVLDGIGRRLGIDTSYLAADLFEIQYKQSNDVMWLTHGSYAQRKLSRTSASAFSLDEIVFTKGPFKTRNDLAVGDDITLEPSVITGTGTLTASDDVFDIGHIGALFAIYQPRVNKEVSGSLTAPNTGVIGSSILVEGSFSFSTHGTWTGTVELERSLDDSTWETFYTIDSSADRNALETWEEEEDGIFYRINVTSLSDNTASGTSSIPSKVEAKLTINSSLQRGICRVINFTSATSVDMTVLKDFASTDADVRWQEGSWSTYRGFPACVTFFEGRCVYASTEHQPQTVWFSKIDDFDNFDECTKDDSAFSLTMSSDTRNEIRWISALEGLLVGTTGGEWLIRSTRFEEALTPTNFTFKQQTSYGSAAIQALPTNDVILFVDFVRRKVRELTYSGTNEKYVAPDLTALAEHVTKSGIRQLAYQQNPDPILWSTRTDGTLLSMTYEREQNVVAWARHPFDVGFGTEGSRTSTTTTLRYPTLQELTASEIPTAPVAPADILLSSLISVTNKAGLQAMTSGNHYSIDANINISGAWTPLDFDSASEIVIEGNGNTISNMAISSASDDMGFISVIGGTGGGQIRNLNFDSCSVTGQSNTGVFCGRMDPEATAWHIKNVNLANCSITINEPAATRENIGILIGKFEGNNSYINSCILTSCSITLALATANHVGGMIGFFEGQNSTTASQFLACSVTGTITTNIGTFILAVGGFIGECNRVRVGALRDGFYNCSAAVDIAYNATANDSHAGQYGGFFGYVEQVTGVTCSETGSIVCTTATFTGVDISGAGGFIGVSCCNEDYANCFATGDLTFVGTATWQYIEDVGGFVGYLDFAVDMLRCYSTSDITITTDTDLIFAIGGFVGKVNTTSVSNLFSRSWAEGDITVSGDIAAGDDGSGDDAGNGYGFLGGFMGFHRHHATIMSDVLNCYAWGSILLTGSYPDNLTIGGFVAGWGNDVADMVFINCYCAQTDSVYGSGYTNQISISDDSHGFGGNRSHENVVQTAIYWDIETSGITSNSLAVGQTTEWLQTQSNFEAAGWDFDANWTMPPLIVTTDYSSSGLGPNSVARIPSTDEDEVWLVVARIIGEETVRYLEQMQPRFVDDQEDKWFVDSGLDYDGVAVSSFSGLDHLEGMEVVVLGDGAVFARETVVNGAITLSESASRVIVGLPFRYKLKPMRFDLTIDGTTKGSLKRFAEIVLSFYESMNVEYGVDVDNLFNVDFRTEEPYDSPPVLYTGDVVVVHEGGYSVEDPIIVTGTDPVGCTLRAMVPRLEVTGR